MRERIAQPEDPSTKVIRDLNAKHPLLVGFTVNVPENYNKYGVTIGKYDKDVEKASVSEIRNIQIIPILAVNRRELEDFNRLRQVKEESEAILAEIDDRKNEELFADWRTDPTVQVLINSDLKGERTHEIGLIDLEKVRPGEAITVSNKLVLKQKVDRSGGFSGKDKDKARRFHENTLAIDYFGRLDEYKELHRVYQRTSDGNERARIRNFLYGDNNGKVPATGELALEPYLKTHYSEVLHILQNRGLEIQGSDEHFQRTSKGQLDFTKKGWQKDTKPTKDFTFKKAGTLKTIDRRSLGKSLLKLNKENRKIAVEGNLDQLKGKTTYYTDTFTLEPVARDLTIQEGDKKTKEKSDAAFQEVIFQDLSKLRTIRQWQAGQDTDDKTKVKQWAIFVHDGINRAVENSDPAEAKRLRKLKTLNMNPMMMERSDMTFVESRLGVVFPARPKTADFDTDFVADQMVIPIDKPAREKRPPSQIELIPLPPPTREVREFKIPPLPPAPEEPVVERRPSQIDTSRPPLVPVGPLANLPQFTREELTEEQIAAGQIPRTFATERPSKHKRRRR